MMMILGLEGADWRISVFLKGGSPGGVDSRVIDLGINPPYGAGPGEFPAQVRATDYREADEEAQGGDMGLSSPGGRYGGGRF